MSRRVAVTGIGLITPLGIGLDATWSGLVEGKSGIAPIQSFDASDYDCRIAGEVEGFEPKEWMDRQQARRFDRFVQFALAGAKMAMKDAGIDGPIEGDEAPASGTIIGSGIGGLPMIETQYDKLRERGPGKVTPFFIPGVIANMASGLVSIESNLQGPNSATCTACSTGSISSVSPSEKYSCSLSSLRFRNGSTMIDLSPKASITASSRPSSLAASISAASRAGSNTNLSTAK